MTKKENKNSLKNHVILATLTTTSNKESEDFKQDVPTKTGYWKVEDEKSLKLLNELGFTQYGKDEKFFIIKLARELKLYSPKINAIQDIISMETQTHEVVEHEDGNQVISKDTPNYSTGGKEIHINIIEGEYKKRPFFRVNAILSETYPLVRLEAENPFLEYMDTDMIDKDTQIDILDDDMPF